MISEILQKNNELNRNLSIIPNKIHSFNFDKRKTTEIEQDYSDKTPLNSLKRSKISLKGNLSEN